MSHEPPDPDIRVFGLMLEVAEILVPIEDSHPGLLDEIGPELLRPKTPEQTRSLTKALQTVASRIGRYQGLLAEIEKYASQPRTTDQTQALIKLVKEIAAEFSPDLPELSSSELEIRIRTACASILGKLRSSAEDLERRLQEENADILHAKTETPRTGNIQPAPSMESGEVILERLNSKVRKLIMDHIRGGSREASRHHLEALDKQILRDLPTILGASDVSAGTNTVQGVIEPLDTLRVFRAMNPSLSHKPTRETRPPHL
jgi:hypothetical protein